MSRNLRVLALAAMCFIALAAVGQASAAKQVKSQLTLNYYSATVSQKTYTSLLAKGTDIAATKNVKGGTKIYMILSLRQAKAFTARGIKVSLVRNKAGLTARQEAALQKSTGYDVWMDYDGPDGFAAYMKQFAIDNKNIASLENIGTTGKGRTIWGIKLTEKAALLPDGHRPSVLYSSTQHAREWIAAETNRRQMAWYADQYRAGNPEIRALLRSTELWFVLVANPDGYQYSFLNPGTRLWRKTLRDNNNNGTIEVGDGVDPNRNYEEHWNYDNEGSSGVQSSDTYRGPSAGSEPETLAMQGLLDADQLRSSRSTTTPSASGCSTRRAGRWRPQPRTTRSTTPSRGTRTTRRFRASSRVSRRTSST